MIQARLAERIAESDRLEHGQRAEGRGLRAASIFDKPYPFSRDAYQQDRFELGFKEGKTILEVHHAAADSGAGTETSPTGLRGGESDDHVVRAVAAAQPSPYSA